MNARRLIVNGESVHVFQYPDAGAATEEAIRVVPSGSSVGGTQITWVDPPRFFKSGLLIVLYVGRNQEVSTLLEAILGPPFAGRRWVEATKRALKMCDRPRDTLFSCKPSLTVARNRKAT